MEDNPYFEIFQPPKKPKKNPKRKKVSGVISFSRYKTITGKGWTDYKKYLEKKAAISDKLGK